MYQPLTSTTATILAFLIAANPAVFRATRGVLGSWVASQEGTAKMGGLVLHAIVFMLIVYLLKRLVSPYDHWGGMDTHGKDEVGGLSTKAQEVPHTLEPAPFA
jgi:hypothetical protein